MTEGQYTKVTLSRNDFLESFVHLYHAIKDYDELLTSVAEDDTLTSEQVRTMVQERMNFLDSGSANTKAMELVGAYIRFTMEKFKGDKLSFLMPDQPDDSFFEENDGFLDLSKSLEGMESELHEIGEKVYYLTRFLPPKNIEKTRRLMKAVAAMFKSVIRKDFEDMESHINHIHHLTASKESYFMINDVGRMVREIYNSLEEFSSHVTIDELDPKVIDEMPDAIDKLNLVIQRMEQAANSTLDDAEVLLEGNSDEQQNAIKMREDCSELLEQLIAVKESHPEVAPELNGIISRFEKDVVSHISGNLENLKENENIYFRIIGNQSFQDITGQTIKKIISFIEELELKLLNILKKYSGTLGEVERIMGKSQAPAGHEPSPLIGRQEGDLVLEGPQDNAHHATGGVVKQADIDNMLAEFGF